MSAVSVGKLPQFLYYPGMKGIIEALSVENSEMRLFKGSYGRFLLDIVSDRLRLEVCNI